MHLVSFKVNHWTTSAHNREIQIHEIEKLIPDVLKVLAEDGHGTLVKDFFQLFYEKKFPLKNIAFRLCADVAEHQE
jgi:hypothetical protein